MDGRRARLIAPMLDSLPRLAKSATEPARHPGQWLATVWAALLGIGWPLAFVIGVALEPTPAHAHETTPVLVAVGSDVLLAALVITVVTAARRRPAAAVGGVVTGLIAVGFSAACPLSGHHTLGLWWVGQLGLMVTMLGLSVAALGARARATA